MNSILPIYNLYSDAMHTPLLRHDNHHDVTTSLATAAHDIQSSMGLANFDVANALRLIGKW